MLSPFATLRYAIFGEAWRERARHGPRIVCWLLVGRWLLGLVVTTLPVVWTTAARAQQDFVNREHQIKAAYLYNFGKYVLWPSGTELHSSDNRSVFVIAVVGESSIVKSLSSIARTKKLKDIPIVIRKIKELRDYQPCHVLFVSTAGAPDLIEAVLKKARGSPTLIVGESERFTQTGGMIGFYMENNRLRFAINVESAKQAGLRISSRLLSLGKLVRTGSQATGRF